jgi:hypothetical protein
MSHCLSLIPSLFSLFPRGQAGMGLVGLLLAEERSEYFDRGRVKRCVFIVE